jgi:hypothetical protein
VEAREVIDDLETALAEVKAQNKDTVAVSALEKYLDELRTDASVSIETRKLEYQRTLAHYDAQTKHAIEMFRSVIESGKEALNAVVLINGGAAVALFGFLGATLSKGFPATLGVALTVPLLAFGSGVLCGALGFGARYCSQAAYSGNKRKAGLAFTFVSIGFAIAAYSVFGYGVYKTYTAFLAQFAS